MLVNIFVTSIVKTPNSGVIVTASNGGLDGPPAASWFLPTEEIDRCYIGKPYTMEITASS